MDSIPIGQKWEITQSDVLSNMGDNPIRCTTNLSKMGDNKIECTHVLPNCQTWEIMQLDALPIANSQKGR